MYQNYTNLINLIIMFKNSQISPISVKEQYNIHVKLTFSNKRLTLSRKHWKNHFKVYRPESMQFLSKCFFSLGRNFSRILSWCCWYLNNLGNPGIKKPAMKNKYLGFYVKHIMNTTMSYSFFLLDSESIFLHYLK